MTMVLASFLAAPIWADDALQVLTQRIRQNCFGNDSCGVHQGLGAMAGEWAESLSKMTDLGGACALSSLIETCGTEKDEAELQKILKAKKVVCSSLQRLRFDWTAVELESACHNILLKTKRRLKDVATVAASERTTENSLLAFETAMSSMMNQTGPLVFLREFSTDAEVRTAAKRCELSVDKLVNDTFLRKDLYLAVKRSRPRDRLEARLQEILARQFEVNGVGLSDAKIAQLNLILDEINEKKIAFSENLAADWPQLEMTREQLKGVPQARVDKFERSGEKYKVSTQDWRLIMENAEDPEVRRTMLKTFQNRGGPTNTKLLEETLALRDQMAQLLGENLPKGHKTWGDFKLANDLDEDPKKFAEKTKKLGALLRAESDRDLQRLLEEKKKIDPAATTVEVWDVQFLTHRVRQGIGWDAQKVKEYFPAEKMAQRLFSVYSKALGVEFKENRMAPTWHPTVRAFDVIDPKTGAVLGSFYTDIYRRANKRSSEATAVAIVDRQVLPSGEVENPVSVFHANLPLPKDGEVSLLTPDQVKVAFHEFGHIMHQVLTKSPYGSLAGAKVAEGVREAPSIVYENFVYTRDGMAALSGHYQDETKKLPTEMINKAMAAYNVSRGYDHTRQYFLGEFDRRAHSSGPKVDTNGLYDQLHREIMGLEPVAGGAYPASFNHIMSGGYDGTYSRYAISAVYAENLLQRFKAAGHFDPRTNMEYRHQILEQGNLEPFNQLVEKFQGQPTSVEVYTNSLKAR